MKILKTLLPLILLISLTSELNAQNKWDRYFDEQRHHAQVWSDCGPFYDHYPKNEIDKKIKKFYPYGPGRPRCTENAKKKWNKEIEDYKKSVRYYYLNFELAWTKVPNASLIYTTPDYLDNGIYFKGSWSKGGSSMWDKSDNSGCSKMNHNDASSWAEILECYARFSRSNYEKLKLNIKHLSYLDKDISHITNLWGPYSRVINNGSAGMIYIWENSNTTSYTSGDSKIRYNWFLDTYTIDNQTKTTQYVTKTSFRNVYVNNRNKIQKLEIGTK